MSSLGSTPKLRTNCRMLLMKEKACQEDQRKRQKMMSSPRGHNSTRAPSLLPPSVNVPNVFRNNRNDLDLVHVQHSHLEPILSDDFTPVDSINTPYSLTPSSMTTSVSEYDTLFEDINEIVEKESHTNSSFSEKVDKNLKAKVPTKAPLKTSSSCPSIRPSARLALPSKLDPSDFPDIDAYKKEKHNIVEKKRRYKINDCIQELADLLPTTYDVDLNMKKGYILEKSVEYIQELKKDSEKKAETEGRVKELERENRQLHLELQNMRRTQEALRQQRQQQQQLHHQQQQQQQQQLFLVSPNFQSQHHASPHSNPIILSLADNFLNNNNNSPHHQQHQQQQHHDYNQSVFISDFTNSEAEAMEHGCMTGVLDADALMSNLQVSNELTDLDRQELNGFINLEEISGDDILMTEFGFHQPSDQF